MPVGDLPTDDSDRLPWLTTGSERMPRALHLVVVWLPDEPDRVGQAAAVLGSSSLGRGQPESGGGRTARLSFSEQRPGPLPWMPPLGSPGLSRRQLELQPLDQGRLSVRNVGRRALLHNGVPVTDCAVAEGDTLLVEQTAGFLVEERLIALDPFPGFDALPRFPFGAPDPFGMVGESPASWALRAALASAAAADEHLLLLGESGSGKEVAAALLHGLSPRRRGPLVARNAATMPESLLDAELFGSARDYPNRGSPERPGLVGEAHGGHLMLDEIGELPQGHQAHLLRVLDQHGEYHRLGEARPRVSDFRLIAATNREAGALKHDFLARFPRQVRVPRLDERRSDVPLLIRALVARMARRTPERLRPYLDDDDPRRVHLEPRLLDALLRHSYRLHVRELHRLLELSLATSGPSCLELTAAVVEELTAPHGPPDPPPPKRTPPPPPAPRSAPPPSAGPPRPPVGDVEAALAEAEGNVSHAALRLGISRFALIRLMRNYGLVRRDDSEPE